MLIGCGIEFEGGVIMIIVFVFRNICVLLEKIMRNYLRKNKLIFLVVYVVLGNILDI